jgi:hypothetical protein
MDSSKVHQRRHRGRHHGARYGARHLGAVRMDKGVATPGTARLVAPGTAPGGFGCGRAAERRADTARVLEEMDDAQAVLEKESGAQRPVACPQRRVACLPAAAAAAAAHDGATVSMRRLGGAASAAAAAATGGSVGARDGAGSDAPATAPHAPDDAAGRGGWVGRGGRDDGGKGGAVAGAVESVVSGGSLVLGGSSTYFEKVDVALHEGRGVHRAVPSSTEGMAARPSSGRRSYGPLIEVASSSRASHTERLMSGAVLGACTRAQLGMRATSHASASSSAAAKLTSSGATRK